MKARDTKLKEALQEFFKEEGDTHQLEHIIDDALDSLPLKGIGLNAAAQAVLRKAFKSDTIAPMRGKSYQELVKVPGVSRGVALLLLEVLHPLERKKHDRPACRVQPDTETA